jgi:SSS family solute:Na+ symporter
MIAGLALIILAVNQFTWLYAKGVFGMVLFLIFIAAFCMVITFTKEKEESAVVPEVSPQAGPAGK